MFFISCSAKGQRSCRWSSQRGRGGSPGGFARQEGATQQVQEGARPGSRPDPPASGPDRLRDRQ